MPRITCAAACKHADLHRQICLKDHITIAYKRPGCDWPCLDFEPRTVTPKEFENCLFHTTNRERQPK